MCIRDSLFTDRSKWILVACSSWYTGRGPELTIDGDVSTKFENRYNDIGRITEIIL